MKKYLLTLLAVLLIAAPFELSARQVVRHHKAVAQTANPNCVYGTAAPAGTSCGTADLSPMTTPPVNTDAVIACQEANGCYGSATTVKWRSIQLPPYIRSVFSATSPIALNTGTGAFSLNIDSTLSVVGGQLHVVSSTGGGNVSTSGTITTGTIPLWVSGTTISGTLATGFTGSGAFVPQTSGGLLSPTVLPLATNAAIGGMRGDGTTILCSAGVCQAVASVGSVGFSAITGGTNTSAAMVIGSGASIAPTGTGTITATGPLASSSAFGLAKVDGTSITASGGVISASASAPPVGSNTTQGILKCDGQTTDCTSGIIKTTGPVNPYTASHTLVAADMGATVVMNCTTCTTAAPAVVTFTPSVGPPAILQNGQSVQINNENAVPVQLAGTGITNISTNYIPVGGSVIVNVDASGVLHGVPLGNAVAKIEPFTYAEGMNLSTNPRSLVQFSGGRGIVVVSASGTPDALASTTNPATCDLYWAATGNPLGTTTAGNGGKLTTTSYAAGQNGVVNTPSANLIPTGGVLVAPGSRIGWVCTGAGWTNSVGAGVIQAQLQ